MKNRLPLGIQTFSEMISDGYIYADKTAFISRLVDYHKYAFLSRPRRFGKSLLVSILEEFFSGEKELFNGLAIYDYPKWQKHPVIRLDFSNMETENLQSFRESLLRRFKSIANNYALEINLNSESEYFSALIEGLRQKTGLGVVILIDEYDKPITDHLDKPEIAGDMRDFLRGVFVRMKGNDANIRFVFLTGVSKFAKISLFSGMNQITDISLFDEFASFFGYTQSELEFYFAEYIEELAEKRRISTIELLAEIKYWYNGYSWDGENRVYNPYSILSLFSAKKFGNFWYQTGSPTFLYKAYKFGQYLPEDLEQFKVDGAVLDNMEITELNTAGLFFQTGYLSIKEVEFAGVVDLYKLGFPNYEVKQSFYRSLFMNLANLHDLSVISAAMDLRKSLEFSDIPQFEKILQSLFAQIPSNLYIEQERFYHSLFIMIMYLSGIEVQAELSTNIGRIDGVIEFADKIYILEFKFNLPPEDGLKQILTKKYYEKYLLKGKKIYLVGVGFTRKEIKVKFEV
jgi:hypothetical protein